MRRADFVPKRKQSLADAAKLAAGLFFAEAFLWIGLFLAVWGAIYSIYIGLAVFICWALVFVLIVQDIKALDDLNDNPHADRLIGKSLPRPAAAPSPDSRMKHALGALGHMALRFAVELFKSAAIIVALTLGIGFAAEMVVFALSDRDVSGAFGSGLAGVAGGVVGLVFGVVIVLRRIADIED